LDLNNTTIGQLWEGTNAPKGGNPGGIQSETGYAADTWGAFLEQLGYAEVANESELPPSGSVVHFLNKGPVEEELVREVAGKFETKKVTGEGCEQQIVPQARSAESGTSYAFKTYLSQVNPEVWTEYASDFTNWPSSKVRLEDPFTSGKSGEHESEGGGNLAENTAANPGSVGYANTADAAKNGPFTDAATDNQFGTGEVEEGGIKKKAKSLVHQILWTQIQNDGVEPEPEPTGYIDPLLGGVSHAANCQTSKLTPYDSSFPYSYKDSWAGITTTDPNIKGDTGASVYPICALTYDLVWHHLGNQNLYKEKSYVSEVVNTTKNLMEYIIGEGQEAIQGNYYSRFPSAMQAHVHEGVVHIEK
jgi:hypothetical protein